METKIWCDGACSGNPGPGGWGVVLVEGAYVHVMNGGAQDTTNNRMELEAAIQALESTPVGAVISLTTDSRYVKRGITEWIHTWRKNGWVTKKGTPVINRELWERLHTLNEARHVRWSWVKSHVGDTYNEMADLLAKAGMASV